MPGQSGPFLAGDTVQDKVEQIPNVVKKVTIRSLKRKLRQCFAILRSFPNQFAFVLTALILSFALAPIFNVPCRLVRLMTLPANPSSH